MSRPKPKAVDRHVLRYLSGNWFRYRGTTTIRGSLAHEILGCMGMGSNLSRKMVDSSLRRLERGGKIERVDHDRTTYWRVVKVAS